MNKKPNYILQKWIDGVNNKDVESLVGLYNEKSVLIPTFSDKILSSSNERMEYFNSLGERENLNIKLHENSIVTQNLDDEVFILSGIYTWQFDVENKLTDFEARFSFTLDLSSSNSILHHHSSLTPK